MKTLTMKFGGTSVGSPEAISSVVQIVSEEVGRGSRVVVIVSAMSGVTDALVDFGARGGGGQQVGLSLLLAKAARPSRRSAASADRPRQ